MKPEDFKICRLSREQRAQGCGPDAGLTLCGEDVFMPESMTLTPVDGRVFPGMDGTGLCVTRLHGGSGGLETLSLRASGWRRTRTPRRGVPTSRWGGAPGMNRWGVER